MKSSVDKIRTIDPGTSVLLLGSGFSLEALNIRGTSPPNGTELRKHFLDVLDLDSADDYSLQILADEFTDRRPDHLHRELYEIFRISQPGVNQQRILREDWLRIYTTNYDDVVEACHLKRKLQLQSFDVSDPLPNKFSPNSIVHLHGSLRTMTAENLSSSLVLGEASYVRQYIEKTPWYNQFQKDIRFASKLFIIGYSMSDYHISALLLADPKLMEKTFFIQRSSNPMFARRTREYGTVLPIGLRGFAQALDDLPRPTPLTDLNSLKSFRWLKPQRDQKGLKPPTSPEIWDLLTFGTFNYVRCVAATSSQKYVAERTQAVASLISDLKSNRAVVVDGRLGNGKTILLYLAFIALAQEGYECLLFKGEGANLIEELKLLKSLSKVVILFDNYATAQDILKRLNTELPDAKFVVEIRSSILEVRYHEVKVVVPTPFGRVGVNKLSAADRHEFRSLCLDAGIGAKTVDAISSVEIRDMLLEILRSPNISKKILETLEPIFQSAIRRKILLLTTLLSNFHSVADASFIKVVCNADPFREFADIKDVAAEVFEFGSDTFQVRSSVFAEFAIEQFLKPVEIVQCIVSAILAAATLRADRQYRLVMSNLMQFSNLVQVFRKHSDGILHILGIYEQLRHDVRIREEPLFWLQYAITMVEDKKVDIAIEFIEMAYKKADAIPGFQTYQIDTQSFRILLLAATQAPTGTPVKQLEEILGKLEVMNSMLNEDSHRNYAVRVLGGIYSLIAQRVGDLRQEEKVQLTYWLATISTTLSQLSVDYRAATGSDKIRQSVDSARELLL